LEAINWNAIEDIVDKATWEKLTEQFWLDTRVPLSNDLDDWRKLPQNEKDLIGKVFGGLTLLDTMQAETGVEVLKPDVRTQHEEAVLCNISFMECYTKDHQLLTYDGFKDISEITEDDFVLAYNKDTNTTQFEKVIKTSNHKADKIYHFYNKYFFDLKVSPGHRMLIEEETNKGIKQYTITAEELYNKDNLNKYRIPLNRSFKHEKDYLSENDKKNILNINKRDIKFEDSFDLEEFNSTKARDFILLISKNDENFIYYKTKNKSNKNFIEALISIAGYTYSTKQEHNLQYSIKIKKDENNLEFKNINKEILDSQIVYGVAVPSSYLVVKTKNGLVISGNCVHAKSYSSIFSTLNTKSEIEDIFEWTHTNKYLQKKAEIVNNIYKNGTALEKKVASVFLESFLFYSGFFTPLYYLGNNKLSNVAEIIKLIIRDESVHGTYIGYKFMLAYNELSEYEQNKIKNWAYDLLFELYQNEEKYTEELYDEIGWTEEVKVFLRYNANKALMNLGLDPLFTESANDVNPIVMNGISTGTSNHDFFSQVGNGYLIGQVEATQDSDYNMGLN
jgi:ribonucleoside-diphosphate reductase, beta subunit